MTLLFLEGFEGLNRADKYLSGTTEIVADEPGRVVGVAENIDGGTFVTPQVSTGERTVIFGFALKADPDIVSNTPVYFQLYEGSTAVYSLAIDRISNNFTIQQYAGDIGQQTIGSLLNSDGNSPFMSFGQWVFFEVKVDLGTATLAGSVEIRIDGSVTPYYSQAGVAFTNGQLTTGLAFRTEAGWHFDDMRLFDTNGGVNNDFAGPLAIAGFQPASVGTYSEWNNIGGAANKVVAVTDDNDATLLQTATLGSRQLFNITNVSGLVGTIFGVQLENTIKINDIGQREVVIIARQGSTDYDFGSPFTVANTSPETYFETFETPPAGGSWDIGTLNALQHGLKVTN